MAGEKRGVSSAAVARRVIIEERGSKAVQRAVDAGEIGGETGRVLVSSLPKSEQDKALRGDPVNVARKIREKKAATPEASKTAQMRALREAQREEAVIPQPIRAAWKFLSDAAPELRTDLTSVRRRLRALVEKLANMSAERPVASGSVLISLKRLDADLDAAEYSLARLIPSVVCDKCNGDGCGKCSKVGWLAAVDVKRINEADAKGKAALAKSKR